MKKVKEIEEYLEEHESLWQTIAETEPCLPCGDLGFDVLDEENYYGFDFSKNNVRRMFFLGASNYFPAFCNINKVKSLDQCPIYLFDAESDTPYEYVGNFKHYISIILNEFLNRKKIKKSDAKEAKEALLELEDFSDKVSLKEYELEFYEKN